MNITPECVNETPEIEAREKLAAIFSDAERRDNNFKVNPELGKTALGSYGKSLDYINNSTLETVQAIGNLLQLFREDKTKESCK